MKIRQIEKGKFKGQWCIEVNMGHGGRRTTYHKTSNKVQALTQALRAAEKQATGDAKVVWEIQQALDKIITILFRVTLKTPALMRSLTTRKGD